MYILRDRINILYDLNIELVSELRKYFGRSHGGAIYFTKVGTNKSVEYGFFCYVLDRYSRRIGIGEGRGGIITVFVSFLKKKKGADKKQI